MSGAAVGEAFERPWEKVALEAIVPSGSREALKASSPLGVVEEGREELVEYRPCGENEGHRDTLAVM